MDWTSDKICFSDPLGGTKPIWGLAILLFSECQGLFFGDKAVGGGGN